MICRDSKAQIPARTSGGLSESRVAAALGRIPVCDVARDLWPQVQAQGSKLAADKTLAMYMENLWIVSHIACQAIRMMHIIERRLDERCSLEIKPSSREIKVPWPTDQVFDGNPYQKRDSVKSRRAHLEQRWLRLARLDRRQERDVGGVFPHSCVEIRSKPAHGAEPQGSGSGCAANLGLLRCALASEPYAACHARPCTEEHGGHLVGRARASGAAGRQDNGPSGWACKRRPGDASSGTAFKAAPFVFKLSESLPSHTALRPTPPPWETGNGEHTHTHMRGRRSQRRLHMPKARLLALGKPWSRRSAWGRRAHGVALQHMW